MDKSSCLKEAHGILCDQPREKGGLVDKCPVEKTSIPSTVDPDARASEFLGRA